jgi:hypothetical protein
LADADGGTDPYPLVDAEAGADADNDDLVNAGVWIGVHSWPPVVVVVAVRGRVADKA